MTLLSVEPNVESVGSQTPRLSLVPDSFENEAWKEATELAYKYGLELDEWQQLVLKGWMGERLDGKWTCSICGLSVPRQNGKNGALEARELYGVVVLGESILHTAHELKTAEFHFRRMQRFFEEYEDLGKMVKHISKSNGKEAIILKNGGVIRFVARSKRSGRGFSADLLVLDEAQELSDEEYEALNPVLAAGPLKNPQRILTGTPPSPLMPAEVWKRVRNQGLEGTAERLCWLEWSADSDDRIDSYETWAKANPALGYRLTFETTQIEYDSMSEEGFCRERLGMWSSGSANSVFDMEAWGSLIASEVPKGPYALSIDVSGMMDRASVAVAAYNGESVQVQVIENRRGTGWVADLCAEWQKNKRPFLGVFIDDGSAAASLVTELRAKRIKMVKLGTRDITHAAGMFINRVNNSTLLHADQPALNDAIANARKRPVGDAFAWQKKNIDVDITPLVAATNAAYGLTLKRRPKAETDETETTTKPVNRALFF